MNNKKSLKKNQNVRVVDTTAKFQTVSAPVARSFMAMTRSPRMSSDNSGAIRVQNSEIVLTIAPTFTTGSSSVGVNSTSFNFSGGLNGTWINGLAALYDKFRILKLTLRWQPLFPTSASGGIVLYWDEDANDATSVSFTVAAQNFRAKAAPIYEPFSLEVLPEQFNRLPWFLVKGTSTSDSTSDTTPGALVGNYTAITSTNASLTGANTVGYFWVDYIVEFKSPTATTS